MKDDKKTYCETQLDNLRATKSNLPTFQLRFDAAPNIRVQVDEDVAIRLISNRKARPWAAITSCNEMKHRGDTLKFIPSDLDLTGNDYDLVLAEFAPKEAIAA